jgi:hypothetical protein
MAASFITKPQEYDSVSSGVPRASNRLHHDAARQNGVRKFRGGSAQGSARAEQNHFDAAEIRQAVTIRQFDEARRDHIFRENRNTESGQRRGAQPAQATAGAHDAPRAAAPLKRGENDVAGDAGR